MAHHEPLLPEELRMLRDTARRFMREVVKPVEDKLQHDAFEVPDELLAPLQRKAKEIGLWALRAPTAMGGAGLSLLATAIVAEETARCRMGAYVPACGAIGANVPNPILKGTPYQIVKYAMPAIREGRKASVAASPALFSTASPRGCRCARFR